MSEPKRAVCLNCIDGRVQLPVISWIKDHGGADHVDMITEPGMDGVLADEHNSIDAVMSKVKISVNTNNATVIYIAGHHDCKGNPVDDDKHKTQIVRAVQRVKKSAGDIKVQGLWITPVWSVESLTE